jgi:hypothetical protein
MSIISMYLLRIFSSTHRACHRPATAKYLVSTMAGWTPYHRALEAEAVELADVQERDTAARIAFSRKAGSANHG